MTSATMADQVSAALRGTGGWLGARARTGASRPGGAKRVAVVAFQSDFDRVPVP
jgi:hypothetical protein